MQVDPDKPGQKPTENDQELANIATRNLNSINLYQEVANISLTQKEKSDLRKMHNEKLEEFRKRKDWQVVC